VLREVAEQLEQFALESSIEARRDGFLSPRPCIIQLLGQCALLESKVDLTLAATNDVDVYADYEFRIEQEFRRLLGLKGLELDPLGSEVWMPRETRYQPLFHGRFVTLQVADAEAILLSKGLKAPRKNGPLLTEYLARGASPRFFALSRKYRLNLEQFV
jgi:hypothetical protein